MTNRKALIGNLAPGDIFHAEYPNGASCICLALAVNDAIIQAKRVTTQENLVFDRQTGLERDSNAQSLAVIDSVAPLPSEIRSVFLEMDKKNRELMAMDEESRFKDLERLKLTGAEKKALSFVHSHYSSNLLPPLTK
jgi:hypothetical protein